MKAFLIPLLLLIFLSILSGCLDPIESDNRPLTVYVVNEAGVGLYSRYAHNGNGAGGHYLPANDTSSINFGCRTTSYEGYGEKTWNFTLTMNYGIFGDGDVFAEKDGIVSCNQYSFWIHPDKIIYFEKGRPWTGYDSDGNRIYKLAPWERNP